MKRMWTVILILVAFSSPGQKTQRVITRYPKSKDVKEVYYVLKSDKRTRHGALYSFYKGQLTTKQLKTQNIHSDQLGFKEKGQYENGYKEGLWINYKPPVNRGNRTISNAISEEGKYTKDKKTGIWETYMENGSVIKRFDFDNNKELEPVIHLKLRYPYEARKNGIEGPVILEVNYNNCEPVSYRIITDIGYGCGEAAIQALKEKREMEKKYGVASNKCDKTEEQLECLFKLEQ